MSAASIDNYEQPYETPINKKRQTHNKTQKYRQPSSDFNPEKVNSVLQSIHNNTTDDDEEFGNYNFKGNAVTAKHSDNFKPINPFDFPSKPISMGSEKKENMSNIKDNLIPQPEDNEELKLQELQNTFMNDSQVREYYRKVSNNSNSKFENNKNYYSNSSSDFSQNSLQNNSNQVLIEKLNYMINLLEEQQDEKIGSVTEEVILYSFLGIFIIFVVDSFTKIGKYVR